MLIYLVITHYLRLRYRVVTPVPDGYRQRYISSGILRVETGMAAAFLPWEQWMGRLVHAVAAGILPWIIQRNPDQQQNLKHQHED